MKLEEVILRGTRATQPAATAVPIGTLYFVTDETVLERSNGTTWDSYGGGGSIGEITTTTTGNIDDLNVGTDSIVLLRMNNATLSTLRGMIPARPNQIVRIISIGAGQVNLSHQDTGETIAERRLLNFVTSGITPLAAGVGTATYQYDETTDRWRLIEHEQGAFIDVPYNAGDFTANGTMTWTVGSGDLAEFRYYLKGRSLTVSIVISNSTIGGSLNTTLLILIPNGYTVLDPQFNVAFARMHHGSGASSSLAGFLSVNPVVSPTKIRALLMSTENWSAGDFTNIQGQIISAIN